MTTDETNEAWAHIRDLMHIIVSSFGLPHQIAALIILTKRTRANILQWLTAAESLARRMLLIHAATLPKPNASPPGKAKHLNMKATHGRAGFASDDSEKWSVSFRLTERPRTLARARKRASQQSARPKENALPLAIRIEALIRVCANPEAYAQRLARRLHAAPARALYLVQPIRWKRSGTNPLGAMLAEAQPLAVAAAARFTDSS